MSANQACAKLRSTRAASACFVSIHTSGLSNCHHVWLVALDHCWIRQTRRDTGDLVQAAAAGGGAGHGREPATVRTQFAASCRKSAAGTLTQPNVGHIAQRCCRRHPASITGADSLVFAPAHDNAICACYDAKWGQQAHR